MDIPYSVRAFLPADRSELEAIFLAGRIQAFDWVDPSRFLAQDFTEQTAGETVFVALAADGRPAGFISVWTPDRFIHHLYVKPDHQRRGVGRLLLHSLEAWLEEPWRLKCLLRNVRARRFYARLGWRDAGLGSDSLGEYAEMEFLKNPTGLTE
jgi:GNAT superfamily N-acetyltransferase